MTSILYLHPPSKYDKISPPIYLTCTRNKEMLIYLKKYFNYLFAFMDR